MSFVGVNGIFNRPASCPGAWEEKSTGTQELITSDAEKNRIERMILEKGVERSN